MNRIIRTIKQLNLHYMVLCATLVLSSCGEDGEVGPQGDKGDQGIEGEKGDQGVAGENGVDYFLKSGYFTGTVEGTRGSDDVPFNETFTFEFNPAAATLIGDNEDGTTRYKRCGFADEEGPSMEVYLREIEGEQEGDPVTAECDRFNFFLFSEISPTKLFLVYATGEEDMEITDYEYNATTGVVSFSFDYTNDGGRNSTGNELHISGTFNSGGKVYTDIVSRKGN